MLRQGGAALMTVKNCANWFTSALDVHKRKIALSAFAGWRHCAFKL